MGNDQPDTEPDTASGTVPDTTPDTEPDTAGERQHLPDEPPPDGAHEPL
ncbi:hypothetical protein [Streptosporangium pseudovulgare]|uniref:Uncharacterized protein n=1 Tax=Streptosporangium pseudovulgare TaxID=35765 RepID=A0ABQ2R6W4_9ACTN|nr:hypothetical protein [Streptosporangium pseudovulgare]GGQ13973.1 hypothetical protein GCM10010140_50220 [Streptosporangium pseudovulgare]